MKVVQGSIGLIVCVEKWNNKQTQLSPCIPFRDRFACDQLEQILAGMLPLRLWGASFRGIVANVESKLGLVADRLKNHKQAARFHKDEYAIFETTGDQAG